MKIESFPGLQAHFVFYDPFLEYLEEQLTAAQREDVLVDVVALCLNPQGKHALGNRNDKDALAGWNTLDVLGGEHRVIFSSRVVGGVGLVEVLCAGPRRADKAYDIANALVRTRRLDKEEVTELFEALGLLDVVAEMIGLDGWDYRPPAAPEGMVRAVVAAGLLEESTARILSKDEIEAAMEHGWTSSGADPSAALTAALRRARAGADVGDLTRVVKGRARDRCAAQLPRTGGSCIRRAGHPGPHRSKP